MLQLFLFGWKNAKTTMATQFCIVFVLSLLEGVGLLFVIPLLALTDVMPTPETGLLATLAHWLAGWGIEKLPLLAVLLAYTLATGSVSLLRALQRIGNGKLQFGLEKELRLQLYNALLSANYAFHKQNKPSEWAGLITTQIARFSYSFGQLISLISNIILMIIYVGLMTIVSWKTTLSIMIIIGLAALIIIPFQRKIKELGKGAYQIILEFQQHILQYMTTIKQIKAMAQEDSAKNQFSKNANNIETEELMYFKVQAKSALLYDFIGICSLTVIIVVSHTLLKLPLDGLLLVLVFCARIFPKANHIFDQTHRISHSVPGFLMLLKKMSEAKEAAETPADPTQVFPFEKAITLDNATFYQGQKIILDKITLSLKPGDMIGIAGASGAGKTTLVDGLSGLLLPKFGDILIDKIPLTTENAKLWRQKIGYMDQNPQLYNGSIFENLCWGTSAIVTEEHAWKVLKQVNAADFVKALPEGLETQLTEFGQNLSGGERQRLCLARLLLRGSSVLFLDEAMNHLDAESKIQFRETLRSLKRKSTIFMITHDELDLEGVDQIWRVRKGQVLT